MHRESESGTLQMLLGDFANRLNGAVDFWPVVCLAKMPLDRRSFLLEKSQQMQSVLVSIANVVRGGFKQHDLAALVEGMEDDCRRFMDAFLVLEQFHMAPLEQLRAAAQTLRESYHALRQTISTMVNTLGLDLPEPIVLNPDRQKYFARILDNLFDTACYYRTDAAPVPASNH